jgi:hypothetical protein
MMASILVGRHFLRQSSSLKVKKAHFGLHEEYCRKDVEQAFGVLQSRFTIV